MSNLRGLTPISRKGDNISMNKIDYAMESAKRIKWIRESIGLTMSEVASDCAIPFNTYWERENGRAGRNYNELYVLSKFFNNAWQSKYKVNKPSHKGKTINAITIEFILFGENYSCEAYERLIKSIEEDFRSREMEYINKIGELEAQIVRQ